MQIMVEKGILKRDESSMKHLYSAAEQQHVTQNLLLERFVDSLYNGSASKLVAHLLGNSKTSVEELAAIRELLNDLNKKGKSKK